uniref:SH3 domain-containing protein n=1 Tax=Leptobrachium leishanense TaxID=445787 RepID=A0A8C5QDF6_9ANUR
MPSENNLKHEVKEEPRPTHAQLISQPVVSQTYTCLDTYETKDTKGRLFRVKTDEQVGVLIKDSSGWWLVENEDKQLAWFPAPFLIELKEEIKRNSVTDGIHYFVSKGYEAQNKDELTVSVGVVVEVLEKSDVGWWHICYNGRNGYVPSVFLKPYKNPHQKLQGRNVNNELGSSPNLMEALKTPEVKVRYKSIPMEAPEPDRGQNIKQNLDRRKSRSLNGLLNPTQPSVADLFCSQQPSGRGRKGTVMWDDLDMDSGGKGDVASDQARKDSGFDEPFSARNDGLSTSSPCFDNKLMPPQVPPRPTSREILAKCTSVTRNAVMK